MIFLSGSYIFSRVYAALAQREGKKTTLPTLVSMTGLTETQIQNTIANARRTNESHRRQINVVEAGRVWKFKGDLSVGGYVTPDKVVEEVEVGAQHIWKVVLAALISNAGNVTSKKLLAELASTPEREITPLQVANAMLTIMRQPNIAPNIEVLWAGNAWRYTEPVKSASTKSTSTKSAPTASESASEDTKPTTPPIRGSVLRYFAQKPGVTVFLDDIVNDLGFTKKQVQSAIWHLLNENEATKDDFTVITSSYAWQYKPNREAKVDAEVKPELNGHGPAPRSAVVHAATPPTTPAALPAPTTTPQSAVATTGRLFEEIGQTTEGAILIKEAESNVIYRATPLA